MFGDVSTNTNEALIQFVETYLPLGSFNKSLIYNVVNARNFELGG